MIYHYYILQSKQVFKHFKIFTSESWMCAGLLMKLSIPSWISIKAYNHNFPSTSCQAIFQSCKSNSIQVSGRTLALVSIRTGGGQVFNRHWTAVGKALALDRCWKAVGQAFDSCWTVFWQALDRHWTGIGQVLEEEKFDRHLQVLDKHCTSIGQVTLDVVLAMNGYWTGVEQALNGVHLVYG